MISTEPKQIVTVYPTNEFQSKYAQIGMVPVYYLLGYYDVTFRGPSDTFTLHLKLNGDRVYVPRGWLVEEIKYVGPLEDGTYSFPDPEHTIFAQGCYSL